MPTIHIDNRPVEVAAGETILAAARKLGIDIPALCYRDGCQANTTCMACVVKVEGRGGFVPSCATLAEEHMRVASETDDVRSHRRTALELLVSDHLGDCIAPCQSFCPAGMDIPRMIRQIAAGRMREAIETVKADIALPAVLGLICPAPCEKACRRGAHDAPVSVCLLKRHAADVDLASAEPYLAGRAPATGKSVAVVGAGPTGLAAAYYLLQRGCACTLLDDRDEPGGMLRCGVEVARLPRDVLDAEIDIIRRLGATFRTSCRVGERVAMSDLRKEFDAVFVAAGVVDEAAAGALALPWAGKAVRADRHTYATGIEGVFAACSSRQHKMAVRAVGAGKAAAAAIGQFLAGQAVGGLPRPFSVRIGKLKEGEIDRFMEGVSPRGRIEPAGGDSPEGRPVHGPVSGGLSPDEARAEAQRCLHCDCRRADDCKLRKYADAYGASPSRYETGRRAFEQFRRHARVIFEPGKCIKCGLCVQITARAGERLGLTFVGRGFRAAVAVPFGRDLREALEKTADECVAACPTAALAFAD